MLTFMDGASSTGARVASVTAATGSSAWPAASRAIAFAVAGAMMTRSAESASWMWPIVASSVRLHRSVNTGRRVSAWNVIGPMNFCAPAVIATSTFAPALSRSRTSSAAL